MSIAIPTFFEIRDQISNLLISVFGTDLNTEPNSPTGQQIDLLSNSYLQLYQLLQAVDLNGYAQQAQGQSLDNLLALINVFRPQGTKTVVPNVTVTGTPGTIIPVGSFAQTSSGNLFYSGAQVTIPGSGTDLVDFYAETVGAIAVEANQLNQIVTVIPGWVSVNNGSEGVTGEDTVSDKQLRENLPKLVNQYSMGYLGSIQASIYQNTSVLDVFIYENDLPTVSPPPFNSPNNSLWIILYYEDESEEQKIAESIFNSKAAVATYSSNDSTQIIKQVEDISGTSHDVSWNRATKVPLYISVRLFTDSQLTIDASVLIKQTLVDYIKETHKIGAILFYSRLLCSIAEIDDNIEVEDLWVSTINPPTAADTVDVVPSFNEIFTLDENDIEIILL